MNAAHVISRELPLNESLLENFCSVLSSCGFFIDLRYSSFCDKCVMLGAIFCAILSAVCVPMVVLLFGNMMSVFFQYHLNVVNTERKAKMLDGKISRRAIIVGLLGSSNKERNKEIYTYEHLVKISIEFAYGVTILGTIKWVTAAIFMYSLNHTAHKFALKIRIQYVKAILSNDLAWFDKQNNSELCSSTIHLINNIYNGLGEKLGLLVHSTTVVIACFTAAVIREWKLFLLSIAVFPIFITVLLVGRKILKWFTRNEFRAYAVAEEAALDSILNIRHVTLYGGKHVEIEIFHDRLSKCQREAVYTGAVNGVILGILWVTMYCGYACTFYYGVKITLGWDTDSASSTAFSPSDLIIVFFCAQLGMLHVINIPMAWKTVMKARTSAEAVFKVIDNVNRMAVDIPDDDKQNLDEDDSPLVFENVHFSYPTSPTNMVLRGLSFKINQERTVVFVGPNISEISTVMRLILRLYDPQKGHILLEGWPLTMLTVHWLRTRVSYVMQDSVLFGMTFAEALRSNHVVTQKQMMEAAVVAGCHEYIMQTSQQYTSQLTANVPDDILQRMVVARALLNDPNILILENATSSLTPSEELKLHMAINKFGKHKILLLVSHRVETIARADRVVHIINGRVAEEGTFVELMKRKGTLYHVYKQSIVLLPRRGHGWPDSLDAYEPVPTPNLLLARNMATHHRLNHVVTTSLTELCHSNAVYICRYPTPLHGLDVQVDYAGFVEGDQEIYTWTTVLKLNTPEWLYLTTACVASAIAGLLLPAYAVMFGDCLQILASQSSDYPMLNADIVNYTYLFLTAAFVTGLSKVVQWYMISVAGAKMTKRLRMQLFKTILSQELAWFDEEVNKVEELLKIIRVDARNARQATGPLLTAISQAIATMITCFILALHYSSKMALVLMLLATPLLLSILYYNAMLTRSMFSEGLSLYRARSTLYEAVSNIRSVLSLGLQKMFLRQFALEVVWVHSVVAKGTLKRSILFGMCLAIPCYIYGLCMAYASHLLRWKQVTPEEVFQTSEAVILGTIMMGQLIAISPKMVQARISASRILKVLSRSPLVTSPITDYRDGWRSRGEVKFRRVGFSHRTKMGLPVLKNFNLWLDPGATVALVGTLGGGRSVPIQLLLRFYNPTAGTIMVDELDTADINLAMMRGQIGLADGNPLFFRRSIRDNIAYGDTKRRIKMDEITCASKEANIHNYITTLPDEYYTMVDDRLDMTYSQKLRLSLARALYRDPPILLVENLEKAESEEAEMMIELALNKAVVGRTCIISSNFVRIPMSAAHIVCVLCEGRMVERGTHTQLMQLRGIYYRLCCREELLHRTTDSSLLFEEIVKDAASRTDVDDENTRDQE